MRAACSLWEDELGHKGNPSAGLAVTGGSVWPPWAEVGATGSLTASDMGSEEPGPWTIHGLPSAAKAEGAGGRTRDKAITWIWSWSRAKGRTGNKLELMATGAIQETVPTAQVLAHSGGKARDRGGRLASLQSPLGTDSSMSSWNGAPGLTGRGGRRLQMEMVRSITVSKRHGCSIFHPCPVREAALKCLVCCAESPGSGMVAQGSYVSVPAGLNPQESRWDKTPTTSGLKAESFFFIIWEAAAPESSWVSPPACFPFIWGRKKTVSCSSIIRGSLGCRFNMKSSLHWLQ